MFLLQLYNIWYRVCSTSTFYLPNQSSYPLTPISLQEHKLLIEISSKFRQKRTKSQQLRKVLSDVSWRNWNCNVYSVYDVLTTAAFKQQACPKSWTSRARFQFWKTQRTEEHIKWHDTRQIQNVGYFCWMTDPVFATGKERRLYQLIVAVVQSPSHVWIAAYPGLSVLHLLPEFTQVHVHWIGDAIKPSHPWLPSSPFAFNLSQHQGLFQWIVSSNQVAKVLELQLQHQSFQWVSIQGWFPLGLTGLICLLSKGLSRFLSSISLKTSILKHSAFFMVQLSHTHKTTGKTIALTIWTRLCFSICYLGLS